MSTATSMPKNIDAMGDDTDILDKLIALIQGNGNIPDETRNTVIAEALFEMIRRTRKIERESIAAVFRRKPVQTIAVVVVAFVLLHEFATYIGLGVLLRAAAKILGVPIE